MTIKICSKCNEEKQSDEFYKDKTRKDGVDCWCKSCRKNSNKRYQQTHREGERIRSRNYHRRHILGQRAENGLTVSIYGLNKRNYPGDNKCEVCNREVLSIGRGNGLRYHHFDNDYNIGIWLCNSCHCIAHIIDTGEQNLEKLEKTYLEKKFRILKEADRDA